MATVPVSVDIDLGSGARVVNSLDPSSAQDLATKAYVDSVATGLDVKASVKAATTADITLSGSQTIDGVSIGAGDRVLVKNQSTGSQNGIYVAAAGAWSRSTDADTSAEVTAGMFTFVDQGTANGDSGWVLTTNDPITLGTTALVFSKFASVGGSAPTIPIVTSLPTASSGNRGELNILEASGQPDRLYVCRRLGNGTYDWLEVGV